MIRVPDPSLEERVAARLEEIERALREAVRSEIPLVSEASRHLVAAGGKRFRPLLVVLGSHLGDPETPAVVPGAVAIELTHLASLYHDDVIDQADARRGVPSVNAEWGNTVAVLTGDYLFARSSEISAELGTEVSRLLAANSPGTACPEHARAEVSVGVHVSEHEGRLTRDRRQIKCVLHQENDVHVVGFVLGFGGFLGLWRTGNQDERDKCAKRV